MVTVSGFENAMATRNLIIFSLVSSITASSLAMKHYLPIEPVPHLWPYLQFYRVLTFESTYTSSTELLFCSAIVYQLRTLERLWGSRKFASFVLVNYLLCSTLTVIVGILLKILTFGKFNLIPAGPTSLVFAMLTVWRNEVPELSSFKILLSEQPIKMIGFGDKWTTYVLAAQLAFSQFPYSLPPAVVGYVVGSAWSEGIWPESLLKLRVPGWVVGQGSKKKEQYEGLRRRLEADTDGMRANSDIAVGSSTGIGRYFGS